MITGPIRGSRDKLNNNAKTIHNKTGYLISRFKVLLRFADLWAGISAENTKKAKVTDASHATIGTLSVSP